MLQNVCFYFLILGFENMQIEQHTDVVHIMVISVT